MNLLVMCTGDIAEGRAHYDRAIALYKPAEHRPLATRFGQDASVSILSYRSIALWMLGYPEAALADTEQAINNARDIGQAATLMYALAVSSFTPTFCGNFATAKTLADELVPLAEEKGTPWWKAFGMMKPRLDIDLDRKNLECGHVDHFWDHFIPVKSDAELFENLQGSSGGIRFHD